MTQRHDPAPVQEPGIGGPVDLAGIEAYRRVRMLAICVLLVVTIAILVMAMWGWLDWPEDFAPRRWLPIGILALHGYVCASLALSISTGNRTETRLVIGAAALAAGVGVLVTSGCAALLLDLDPAFPAVWRTVLPVIASYPAVLPVTLAASILADRRYKRLGKTAEEAKQGQWQKGRPKPPLVQMLWPFAGLRD